MQHHSNCSKTCSRGLSRVAFELIEEHIIPALQYHGIKTLPPECPYNDACFQIHEDAKRQIRRDKWECGLCGKLFKSEHYIDQHFHHKHSDETSPHYCVADQCSYLKCHHATSKIESLKSLKSDDRVQLARARSERCDELQMKSRQEVCMYVASSCFSGSQILRNSFIEEYCETLRCDSRVSFSSNEHDVPSLKQKLGIPDIHHTLRNSFMFLVVFASIFYYSRLIFQRRRRLSADGLGHKIK